MEKRIFKDGFDMMVVNTIVNMDIEDVENLNVKVKIFDGLDWFYVTYYVVNNYNGSYDIFEHLGKEPARNNNSHPIFEDISLCDVQFYILSLLYEEWKKIDEVEMFTD